jgi:hypothetical protein
MFKMTCSYCSEMYYIGEGCECWKQNVKTYAFHKTPLPVGYWILYAEVTPSVSFSMYYRPTDEQIKNTEKLLGWTWRDA